MKCWTKMAALVLFAAPAFGAPWQDVDELIGTWEQANDAFQEELKEVPAAERRAYSDEHRPKASDWTPQFFGVVEAEPASDQALRALVWIATYDGRQNARRLMEAFAAHHADADEVGPLLERLPVDPATRPHFEAIANESANTANRGHATWALAGRAKTLYDLGVYLAGPTDPDFLGYYENAYGPETMAAVRERGWKPYAEEAIARYRQVVEHHADLSTRRGTMGEAAERNLFELQNLVPGSVAPEIEGEDIDGVAFKLSDYRGKVVVLDFWGDW